MDCSTRARMGWGFLLLVLGITVARTSAPAQLRSGALQGRPLVPAGDLVVDRDTGRPAVGAMAMNIIHSPDASGPGGEGRYLVAVNSGFGVAFDADTNRAQQSLQVIDLSLEPPQVIQNVYFPAPQSASVGAVFDRRPDTRGRYRLYVSGGVENLVWRFRFDPQAEVPILETSAGPDTRVRASSVSVEGFARQAPSPRYHNNRAPVYPLGIDLSPDGETLYLANNLADNLGIISDLSGLRDLERVDLRPSRHVEAQPYDVVVAPRSDGHYVFVSLWATAEVVRVDPQHLSQPPVRIDVARHPTEMVVSTDGSRLYVVNSNADAVSVIGTAAGQEVERIHTGLVKVGDLVGASPEGLALSRDGARLYAANAHAATVAVIELSRLARGLAEEDGVQGEEERPSEVIGFIPTGLYPTALAVADNRLFVANGKGTGFENSSQVVSESGLFPNAPNQRYPVRENRPSGQDIKSLTAGNLSILPEPAGPDLVAYTQTSMQANGLLGEHKTALFDGPSPIRHVIYVIKENRTYDQVFGDLTASGDGTPADGDPSLAIFGAGKAARLLGGAAQNVTPNHRLLALRFGLLDRFFVNAEASPDGHSWSTAAFSSDYIDKAFRWNYSGRGRTYDFEGFSRLPSRGPSATEPPILPLPVTAQDIADYLKRYIPYLQGAQHVAEPSSLYLWDAVLNAGLTTRNYGEFIATISAADLDAFNANRLKPYPDTSTNLLSLPTKRSLENNHCPLFRNYDLATPDVMTVDSYRAALVGGDPELAIVDPGQANEATRGSTRFSVWREEFRSFVADREAGRGDFMPNLSIVRFPNNHTSGLRPGMPTPQFMVAENDFALGLLVQELSHSPYWRDTAVVVVEDDAQNGPDHVDGHRSLALVISAYNRSGALIHEFHNTVSAIRTIELLLGVEPMNVLDAVAVPIDIFQSEPDLTPFEAVLPTISDDNLMNPDRRQASARTRYWMDRSAEQNLVHADMADPAVLNQILWFSVRGDQQKLPQVASLPAFSAMRYGMLREDDDDVLDAVRQMRMLLARVTEREPGREP